MMRLKKILRYIVGVIVCAFLVGAVARMPHITFPLATVQSQPAGNVSGNAASNVDQLLIEPRDGIAPVLTMINAAKKSVDLVMYQLEDQQVEDALIAAHARGVQVKVLLSPGYKGASSIANAAAYTYLQFNNIPVRWAPTYFSLTHEKSLLVDDNAALIMTFNFTPQYYPTGREFGIVDSDAADVAAMAKTFAADWNQSPIDSQNGDDLVWSPGSKATLISIINNAHQSLEIYNEEMAETGIENALMAAAQRGVDVRVTMTYSSSWKKAFQKLAAAGVNIHTYAAKAPLYIHAKMILADDATAFVGSENFSQTSLNENRELGIIISDTTILKTLSDTFNKDYQTAPPFSL